MDKLKGVAAEIIGWIVSVGCWLTPGNCDHAAKILAVLIGVVTLLFITMPKAWQNIRRTFKW